MIKILMNGCMGKMGKTIAKLCFESVEYKIVAGIDKKHDILSNSFPIYESFDEIQEKVDVVIDYSNSLALPNILKYCINNKTALIVATTGLSQSDYELIRQASFKIPIFCSGNMSLGVNLIIKLAVEAAKTLYESFDIEIIEKHHNEKKDAPSGTAYMIADSINEALNNQIQYVFDRSKTLEKRNKNEIGILSLRGGNIPGEHTVVFAGQDEIIEIKHTAMSREIFARGTLKAVKYIINKENGLYDMKKMLEE